jgi:predicted nucleotidyltransferase component of viral defense system
VKGERPTNMAASVHRRLLDRVAERGENPNETLQRYVLERFLYRLSRSAHATSLMLKGAMLFAIWEDEPHRATRDIDLLGFGEDSAERMLAVFADVCTTPVEDDGVSFDAASVAVSEIRERQIYQGKRVTVNGRLGNARLRVQVDIGFGDCLVHHDEVVEYPTLLGSPAPRLRAYPVEAVVAEKLHAMAEHGMLNSRMKDLFDVYALSQRLGFDGKELTAAIAATFGRRNTVPLDGVLAPLTAGFSADPLIGSRWRGFVTKNRLEVPALAEVCEALGLFLNQPLATLAEGRLLDKRWRPGGPWQVSSQ